MRRWLAIRGKRGAQPGQTNLRVHIEPKVAKQPLMLTGGDLDDTCTVRLWLARRRRVLPYPELDSPYVSVGTVIAFEISIIEYT